MPVLRVKIPEFHEKLKFIPEPEPDWENRDEVERWMSEAGESFWAEQLPIRPIIRDDNQYPIPPGVQTFLSGNNIQIFAFGTIFEAMIYYDHVTYPTIPNGYRFAMFTEYRILATPLKLDKQAVYYAGSPQIIAILMDAGLDYTAV